MKIIGSFVSPYVRKVLACLELKGLDYEVDPITPFYGNDEFERLSPLRRIPVLVDGDLVLTNSSVICAYLDEAYPGHAAVAGGPEGPRPRPLARGICRHPAGRCVHLGAVLPEDRSPAGVGRARRSGAGRRMPCRQGIPAALDYLEGELPARASCSATIGLADIAIASFFRNARLCRFRGRSRRWPKVARFVGDTLAHPVFEKLRRFEQSAARREHLRAAARH